MANAKADEIRSQGLVTAGQTSNVYLEQIEEGIQRLNDSKFATIRLEQEKLITEVVRHVNANFHSQRFKKRVNSLEYQSFKTISNT